MIRDFNRVLIVLVVYRQYLPESEAFQSVLRWCELADGISVFAYDNSPQPQPCPYQFVTYVHDATNPGVSQAYNHAAKFALENKKDFLLLMDQDTRFESACLAAYASVLDEKKIAVPLLRDGRGIVSPFLFRWGRGVRVKSVQHGPHSFSALRVVNSGMLVPLEIFQAVGGYDERFPLDLSDIVFTDKLRQRNIGFTLLHADATHRLSANHDLVDAQTSRFEDFHRANTLYATITSGTFGGLLATIPRRVKLWLKQM